MSTTITVSGASRTYVSAFDDEYKKALDAGNTKLGKVSISAPKSGESHLIKSINPAGKGRRATVSLKDKFYTPISGVTSDETTAVTFYFPKGDAEAAAILTAQAIGLLTALTANEGQIIKELVLGIIEL